MIHFWTILVAIIAGGVVAYFAREIGKGLESVMKKALNTTVVPKLDEIIDRLEALERKSN